MTDIALERILARRADVHNRLALTHAIESPCVFQLILSPCCCDRISDLLPEVTSQLFRYGRSREERSVKIEGY
jgi:hypothetical protein